MRNGLALIENKDGLILARRRVSYLLIHGFMVRKNLLIQTHKSFFFGGGKYHNITRCSHSRKYPMRAITKPINEQFMHNHWTRMDHSERPRHIDPPTPVAMMAYSPTNASAAPFVSRGFIRCFSEGASPCLDARPVSAY